MAESTDKRVILQQLELITTLIKSQDSTTALQLVQRCERVMQALLKSISFIRKELAGLKHANSIIIAKLDEKVAKMQSEEENMSFIESILEDEQNDNTFDNCPEDTLNQEDKGVEDNDDNNTL